MNVHFLNHFHLHYCTPATKFYWYIHLFTFHVWYVSDFHSRRRLRNALPECGELEISSTC